MQQKQVVGKREQVHGEPRSRLWSARRALVQDMAWWHRAWLALLVGALVLGLGRSPQAMATVSPQIWDIQDNLATYPEQAVPQYARYELTFQVETVAQNPYFPYDPAPPPGIEPGVGITVKGLFTPDNWETVYVQPGFYYQEFIAEIRDGKPWYYPTENFAWKIRFAPHRPGEWQYRIVVQDASGSAESPVGRFRVVPSDNPGFVRVSQRDPRYFEFDDGSLFLGLGFNAVLREERPEELQVLQRNGIQFLRIWLPPLSIFGSAWNPFYESRNNYGGYIPRTGMIAFYDDVTGRESIKLRIDWRENNSGWFDACRVLGYWGTPTEVKPNTRYRIQVTYRGFNIAGPRLPEQADYGFVVKTDLGKPKCYDPGGVVLTNYGQNTPDNWGVIEGFWESGNRNFLPHFWFVLENVVDGEVYVDTVTIQEDLGDGRYGPNIVHKPSTEHHLYFQQRNSFALDRKIEMAERYGFYLKLVILEKGEDIFRKIAADGSFVQDRDELFYGNGRELTAVRWLQRAWWRYLQARWGYSTSVHSWELVNEGNPASEDHYALADELGKYMRCEVFDVPVPPGDGQRCDYDHPNAHMVTTSFWHSFPAQEFWGNEKYPNVDYADLHAYVSTGWVDDPTHERDAAAYHLDYGANVREFLDWVVGDRPTKPIVRGEAGLDFVDRQQEQPDLAKDTQGIWLHNLVWSGVDASGLMELYWWRRNLDRQPGPDGEPGLYEIYGAFARFMADIPLNNGCYRDAQPQVSHPGLRAVGQIDPCNGRAHLWIQNRDHTWRNVVDGVSIPPISGSVTLAGLEPGQRYQVEWWDTYAGAPTETQVVVADDEGALVLDVQNLARDMAVKVRPLPTTSTPEQAQLDVTISPRGMARMPAGLAVQVTLYGLSGGTPLYTFTTQVNAESGFSLPPVKPGSYRMVVRIERAVQRILTLDLEAGTSTVALTALPVGDLVMDNVVDILDFSRLSTQFGRCGARLSADLNGDGCVNAQDLSILVESFGQLGDSWSD